MKKETKAVRIRKLLLLNTITDAAIAKVVKCHVSYVYMIKKAMDKVAPVKFKDQVVDKKKFSEFDRSLKAIVWKGRNPWFGVDKEKTAYSLVLHTEAKKQNIDPKSSKYYTFIDKGMLNYVPPRDEVAEWKAKNDGTPFVGSGVKEIFKQAAVDFNKILDKEYAAKKSILDEAQGIIWGDREKTYGEPDVNLKRIATLWNAFLVSRYKHGYTGEPYEITSEDVCWMMVLLKASRQMNTPKRDNLVDAAGYIGLIERIQK
jgi:hypothetical protein